jgi:hypothetical protein
LSPTCSHCCRDGQVPAAGCAHGGKDAIARLTAPALGP